MQKSLFHSSKITGLLVGLLFFSYPFGPAIQNLGMGLFVIFALLAIYRNKQPGRQRISTPALLSLLSILGFLLWNVIATLLNQNNHDQEKISYLLGYAPLIFIPWLAAALPPLEPKGENQLLSLGAVIVLVWGLLSASQSFFPWRWVGTALVPSGIGRAQGFYSHPMSLAYASLLLWPYAIRMLLTFPKKWQSWCLGLGSALMLVYSMSRIAQVLVAGFTLWNIFSLLSGKRRLQILLMTALVGILFAVTDNPVSIRFRHLMQPDRIDHSSQYADDRLVFWQAHLLMIQDRPLLGHGIHLGLDFRKPYYERFGMGDFKKQYQAHNQYLQVLADGGVVGLILYLAWFACGWIAIKRSYLSPFYQITALQCLLIFLIGCSTQNAFDDSSVRTGLVILWLLVFLKIPVQEPGRLRS